MSSRVRTISVSSHTYTDHAVMLSHRGRNYQVTVHEHGDRRDVQTCFLVGSPVAVTAGTKLRARLERAAIAAVAGGGDG